MTLQLSDDHDDVTSESLTGHMSTNNMEQEISSRVGSSCSCPMCSSIDCFKVRYENSNRLCTCPNCKDIFPIQKLSKNKLEDTNEIKTKNKNNNMENANSNSNNASIQSKVYNSKVAEKNHEEDKQISPISENSDSPNKISNNDIYPDISNRINKDSNKALLNMNTEKDLANKDFYEQSPSEATKNIIKEDIQKEITDDNSEITAKDIKDDKQIDFYTKFIIDSDKKCNESNCCEETITEKKNHEHDEQKDTLLGQVKNYFLPTNNNTKQNKTNDKSCSKKLEKYVVNGDKKDAKESTCCKRTNDVSCRKENKKVIKEYKQKDTLYKNVKSKNSEIKLRERTKFIYKDTTFLKDNVKKCEESYTRNYSVAMTYKRSKEKIESENPIATLSAQVMNLPSQELKDSLTMPKTACSLNTSTNKIITVQDFVSKLKEIFKACSCKVCECVPEFSNNNGPTEYTCGSESANHTDKHNPLQDIHHIYSDCIELTHSGCACYRCDRKDCRGVWKKMGPPDCDCKPCDCVKFTKSVTKPCNCEPCQCAQCTHVNFQKPRSVTVAPVQGNFQQNMCQCEPCDCVQCTHNYGAMVSSMMREASTSMVPQRDCYCESCVNSACQLDGVNCRCAAQSTFMRKPINRSVRDYDLRRAIIGENNNYRKTKHNKFKNCDTIAMYTFSNNSNPVYNTFGHDSLWLDCDCILCKDLKRSRQSIAYLFEDFPPVSANLSHQSFSSCKCQHCKCQFCSINKKAVKYTKKTVNYIGKSKYSFEDELADNLNEYCKDYSNISRDSFYPLRKGKVLTPSMFEARIHSYAQSKTQSSSSVNMKKPLPSKSILRISGQKSNRKLLGSQNVTIGHFGSVQKIYDSKNKQLENLNLIPTNDLNNSNKNAVSRQYDNTTIENSIEQYDTNVKESLSSIAYSSTSNINKSLTIIMENSKNNVLTSQNSMTRQSISVKTNIDLDLFCKRILSFEKSISHLQEDISRNLKCLLEIRSKNLILQEKLHSDTHEVNMIGSKMVVNLDENPINNTGISKVNDNFLNNIDSEHTANKSHDTIHSDNDNFSKGDNKIYTNPVKTHQVSLRKLRKKVLGSRVKKVTINSEKNIAEFLRNHLKDNCRKHQIRNKLLNHELNTKSASTIYENCFVGEHKNFQIDNNDEHPQMENYQKAAKLLSVLKSLDNINNTSVTHTGVCTIPAIALNIKRSIQCTSMQTDEALEPSALNKLQTEVSKLLNSPLLQLDCVKRLLQCNANQSNYVDSEIRVNPFEAKSFGRNCESLKASFLCLQRVSDHTVLVRWRTPRDVQYVQGYELQVDGRAMQKILSPTKCMAVLTCLPHCEKLLLTIRTLTTTALSSDHHLAATVVYRPREKCSRLYAQYFAEDIRHG